MAICHFNIVKYQYFLLNVYLILTVKAGYK